MRHALFTIVLLSLAGRGAPAAAAPAAADTGIVVQITSQGSAELADSRGGLRVFSGDVRVEYRAGGRGPGLDAGAVTLDGKPLRADARKKGGVSYKAGRDPDERAGANPWLTLMNAGGAVPADTVRVKLAPYPVVTRPLPGQGVSRMDDLQIVLLQPVTDVWYRVSLVGTRTVTAVDMTQGRWIVPAGSLKDLESGAAHILIEVETSCASCPAGPRLAATWSSRIELEIPITLL
ncbi:MAG: hypothetical protein HYR74_09895 [Candidatus Eisenbacteria bacterium]|nr:hypothetical protein [Candidatus Eisenbacteria bacterium]